MNYFVELTLLANREITLSQLWSKLYGQLHLALVEVKDSDGRVNIGMSFPEYIFDKENDIGILGEKLRIFASSKETLERLAIQKWIKGLADYIHVASIREVPKNIHGYAIYQRKQYDGESAMNRKILRQAHYKAKKENMSYEEALMGYEHWSPQIPKFPFVQMKSLNSKQKFKLHIKKIDVGYSRNEQCFSTYGLSSQSSVPEF